MKEDLIMVQATDCSDNPMLAFTGPFIQAVTRHVQALPAAQWDKFRQQAEKGSPVDDSHKFNPSLTPDTIAAAEMTSDGIPLQAILDIFAGERIDTIADQPVYYFPKQGMYYWALHNQQDSSLSLWLTTPAYPPGW